jgi:hypothetical protein
MAAITTAAVAKLLAIVLADCRRHLLETQAPCFDNVMVAIILPGCSVSHTPRHRYMGTLNGAQVDRKQWVLHSMLVELDRGSENAR